MHGRLNARVASRISGNCGLRSSGGSGGWPCTGRRDRCGSCRALVEDHGEVGRAVGLVQVVGELPQHRRVAVDRADRRAMRVGQRRQAMIGAKDIG